MNLNNTPENGDFARYIENLISPSEHHLALAKPSLPTAPATPSDTQPVAASDQAARLRKAFAPIVPLSLGAFVLASIAPFLDSFFALCARLAALLIGLHVVRLIVTHLSLVRNRLKEHVTQSFAAYTEKSPFPIKTNSKK